WSDNMGGSGIIPENSFHQQLYYPKADLFPNVATDKFVLKGTKIKGLIDLSNPGEVISYHKTFGYADNTPVNSLTEKLPDNPYTSVTEGSGGDAIDIGWAVDQDKKYVKMDEIHFIRIYTGMNALAGWLGEISTEITGIRDVEPAVVFGIQSVIVIQELPRKIGVGQSLDLNVNLFESGLRKPNAEIVWSTSDSKLAAISNGKLVAKSAGKIQLRAASETNPDLYSEMEIVIFSVGTAKITIPSTSLKVNDKLELTGKLTDQNGSILTGINTSWRIENEQIAEVIIFDGKYFMKGKQVGKSWLYFEATENKTIRDSVLIEVVPESALKKVFISVKTSEKTIMPRQSVWVEQVDLTAKVDRNQKNYGLSEINFVSLAHAIASVFKTAGLGGDWAFRDDAEGGSALYLWKVPSVEDGSTVYTFGYGGSRTSEAYRKTWVVMLNQQPVVSGFDKIKINNNDEILIYHITDNNLTWSITHLTSSSDTIKANQSIEIQLKKYLCGMDVDRNVSVNSSEVIASQSIQVEPENQANSKVVLITDEFGKASFSAKQSGVYLISSGIDAAKLFVESVTGNKLSLKNQLQCRVYPNPFSESIKIDCALRIESVEVFNVEGHLVYIQLNTVPEIDLKTLRSGIYILRVKSGSQEFQQKIIKK
ncbi:T9SS type A sorting domain-containing protein, partial [bacterium]|nr:T9SS type A sorting domain-containing protein [bacterium]